MTGCVVDLLRSDPELRIVHQCGSLDYDAVARAAAALPPALAPRYTRCRVLRRHGRADGARATWS